MGNKLEELRRRFEKDDNFVGEKLSAVLNDYLTDFTDELKERILSEKSLNIKTINDVVNALIDIDDERRYVKKNMFPVLETGDYPILVTGKDDAGAIDRLNKNIKEKIKNVRNDTSSLGNSSRVVIAYVYLKASCLEISKLKDEYTHSYKAKVILKNNEEHELDYYLSWSDEVIRKAKKIWEMSRLYGCENPILYSPYSIRLFRVEIDAGTLMDINDAEIINLDLALSDNQLEDCVLLNKELVWNVKIDIGGLEPDKSKSPVGDMLHWKYKFKDLLKNQYIIPRQTMWPTFRVKVFSENEVELDFENYEINEFYKVTVYNVDDKELEDVEVFRGNYNLNKLDKQIRIRSLGDVKYEVEKYMKYSNVRAEDVSMKKQGDYKSVFKVHGEMSLYDKGRFGYKNTNRIYVKFSGDYGYVFFEDYVNFVIGHLTYLFPEIGWEGVC